MLRDCGDAAPTNNRASRPGRRSVHPHTRGDNVALLDQDGFGGFIPQPPATRVALQRAVADWVGQPAATGGFGSDDNDEETDVSRSSQQLIRQVPAPPDNPWLVFALVNEAADVAQLSLSYATSLRILLHKPRGHLICTTKPRGVIEVPEAKAKRRQNETDRSDKDTAAEAAHVLAESEAAASPEGRAGKL